MGMHEFEEVVERSIRRLAASQQPEPTIRSMFYTLYCFQERFDTGFTKFAVMDQLLKHRYVYRFRVQDYPDYLAHKRHLDSQTSFSFLFVKPEEKWDAQNNPVSGYMQDGSLYCDAGSPLWKRFVDIGVLSGEDSKWPSLLPLTSVVAHVLELAEKEGDISLIRMWYPLVILSIDHLGDPSTLAAVRNDAGLKMVRDITIRTNALQFKMDYGYTALPPEEEIKESPALVWWFAK